MSQLQGGSVEKEIFCRPMVGLDKAIQLYESVRKLSVRTLLSTEDAVVRSPTTSIIQTKHSPFDVQSTSHGHRELSP